MIGVTGTNGKTTVVNMIAAALRKSGRRVATVGTLGVSFEGYGTLADGMTTPDPEVLYPLLAELKEKGAQDVVMEASSHALELCKLDAVAFDLGAITNMSAEHLDFHGNMDRYYQAKKKLMEKSKKAVFLTDDYYTSKMYSEADGKKRVSCSCTKNDADCTVREVSCNFRDGASFTAVKNGKAISVKSPIPTFFTVSNALLAYTALCELGVSEKDITEGIASLQSVDGRMERIETGLDFSVYVDFAHTPDALSALLKAVRHMKGPEGRIVTLFGCGFSSNT
jgi:UDP-N-acetylmuramoyl-L-alanyl-D-glutamate--2,6-diaminopimelate ligase